VLPIGKPGEVISTRTANGFYTVKFTNEEGVIGNIMVHESDLATPMKLGAPIPLETFRRDPLPLINDPLLQNIPATNCDDFYSGWEGEIPNGTGLKARCLPCRDTMCAVELKGWIQNGNNTCPKCRKNIITVILRGGKARKRDDEDESAGAGGGKKSKVNLKF
jgi:hypothetical protein